jgi:hypothetical protein
MGRDTRYQALAWSATATPFDAAAAQLEILVILAFEVVLA